MLPTSEEARPKKPLTSYFRLKAKITEQAKYIHLHGNQLNQITKSRWDGLSDSEKDDLKREYYEELRVYKQYIDQKESVSSQNEEGPAEKPSKTLTRRKKLKGSESKELNGEAIKPRNMEGEGEEHK